MQITTTDIIATLRAVVNKNTKQHKDDFKKDISILSTAAKNPDCPEEKRTFLWLSRPMGTYCVPEREAFIKGTQSHAIWTFYRTGDSSEAKSSIAYVVVVKGKNGRKIFSSLYPIDYIKHSEHTEKVAVKTQNQRVYYEKGEIILPSEVHTYPESEELGKIKTFEYIPDNPEALKEVLRTEKERRTKQAKTTTVSI